MQTSLATGNKLEKLQKQVPGFDPGKTHEYTLAIVLKDDGYSFCIAQSSSLLAQQLVAAPWDKSLSNSHPTEKIQWLVKNYPQLSGWYDRVLFATDPARFTPVPTAVYQDGTGTDYFETVFRRESGEQLNRERLTQSEIELIYALPTGLSNSIRLQFPSASLRTIAGILSEHWQSSISTDSQFILWPDGDSLTIWVYKGKKLQYINRFFAPGTDDWLYHLLNVKKQLELEEFTLFTRSSGGGIDAREQVLRDFFGDLTTLSPGISQIPETLELTPTEKHRFYEVLTLVCAS